MIEVRRRRWRRSDRRGRTPDRQRQNPMRLTSSAAMATNAHSAMPVRDFQKLVPRLYDRRRQDESFRPDRLKETALLRPVSRALLVRDALQPVPRAPPVFTRDVHGDTFMGPGRAEDAVRHQHGGSQHRGCFDGPALRRSPG